MAVNVASRLRAHTTDIEIRRLYGKVAQVTDAGCIVAGLGRLARVGDEVEIGRSGGLAPLRGEIVGLTAGEAPSGATATVMAFGPVEGLAIGDHARLRSRKNPRPSDSWLGAVLDADGEAIVGTRPTPGDRARPLRAAPPPAMARRVMGGALETGHAAFDTILPLCRGQRVGVFAGSGVGKSRLMASLAQRLQADSVVIGLIGERGREVREFVEQTLGPEAMARAVVIAATSDQPAPVKRRAAWLTLTVAEHLRDRGDQVLLLFDSVTRFAEAHREVAIASGEPVGHGGFPPSTSSAIAALVERAGPGPDRDGAGDITAVFTVLVAGSDMDEPVADMVRGVLDGHVILSRDIAERGRFPAIDIRRSVSRSLPAAASEDENALIASTRRILSTYEEAEPMIQIGLYQKGADAQIDRAVALWPGLDAFWTEPTHARAEAFDELRRRLGLKAPKPKKAAHRA